MSEQLEDIFDACEENDVLWLRELLVDVNLFNIDGTDMHGFTPLIVASYYGHTEIVRVLLRYKANPNMFANDGCDALLCAVQASNIDIIKELIKYKAKVDQATDNERIVSPIYSAAQVGDAGVIKVLIKAKGNVNRLEQGVSPIFISAQEGHEKCVRTLIKARADCNTKNRHSVTPLLIAAHNSHISVCKELLKCKNIKIDEPTDTGITPLHIAIRVGNLEATKMLIEAGAKLESMDKNGTTALLIAATYGDLDIAEVLIKAGAELNKKDNRGRTAEVILKEEYGEDLNKIVVRNLHDSSDRDKTEGKAERTTFSDIFYAKAKNIFNHFDTNGDNILQEEELRKCLVSLGMDKKMDPKRFEVFVSSKCKNGMDFLAFLQLYRQGMGYVKEERRERAKLKLDTFISSLAFIEILKVRTPSYRFRYALSKTNVSGGSVKTLPAVVEKKSTERAFTPMCMASQHHEAVLRVLSESELETDDDAKYDCSTHIMQVTHPSSHKMKVKSQASSSITPLPRLKLPPLEKRP